MGNGQRVMRAAICCPALRMPAFGIGHGFSLLLKLLKTAFRLVAMTYCRAEGF
jgi:hypothetical protein